MQMVKYYYFLVRIKLSNFLTESGIEVKNEEDLEDYGIYFETEGEA